MFLLRCNDSNHVHLLYQLIKTAARSISVYDMMQKMLSQRFVQPKNTNTVHPQLISAAFLIYRLSLFSIKYECYILQSRNETLYYKYLSHYISNTSFFPPYSSVLFLIPQQFEKQFKFLIIIECHVIHFNNF